MKNRPIGIFDSGIGGLSIVQEIQKLLPSESIIYLADNKNFPYGNKSQEELKLIANKNTAWLIKQDCKMIVVACNTATVNTISNLRSVYPNVHFVGVEPAIKPTTTGSRKGIIILSSPQTAHSKQLQSLINKYTKGKNTYNIESLELVKAIDNDSSSGKIKSILEKALPKSIQSCSDILVLGCTHFPLVKDLIKEVLIKDIKIVDSGESIARRVKFILNDNGIRSNIDSTYKYYTTGPSKDRKDLKFVNITTDLSNLY